MPATRARTTQPPPRSSRWTRDGLILAFALGLGAYEVLIGGGRPSVLSFVGGLILAPGVLRIDESRRRR